MNPSTKYARSGDSHIAYQVVGDGPIDLVLVPQFWSHLDFQWEEPRLARFLRRLSSFARLILFDKRGCGLSDPVPLTSALTLEEWGDDVRAVMDAANSPRAALLAHSGGGPMAILFAATFPERTAALTLLDSYPRLAQAPGYPHGVSGSWVKGFLQLTERDWGTGRVLDYSAPSVSEDTAFKEWWARFERVSASPGAALAIARMLAAVDVRQVLPSIQAPTLVIHRKDHPFLPLAQARDLAESIPAARLVEVPGRDHPFFLGDTEPLLDAIAEFITGSRAPSSSERVLATVLFTDIVGSTTRAAQLGDQRWRQTLDEHDAIADRQLHRFRGRLIHRTGDGLLAVFDGPARAVHCAVALRDVLRAFGLEIRAGLHTGEIEARGDDVAGIGVHIAARVQAEALPGQVLVSRTVTDLVVGSGLPFSEIGTRLLKGVPGQWQLFEVSL